VREDKRSPGTSEESQGVAEASDVEKNENEGDEDAGED